MKYILSEKKNTLDKIKNTLGTAEENTSEFEERNKSTLISTKKKSWGLGGDKDSVTYGTVSNCVTCNLSSRMRGQK